jgi:hypothetical protein
MAGKRRRQTLRYMKNIKTLAVVTMLGLAICSFAIAQSRHGGTRVRGASQHFAEAASAVDHLTEAYGKLTLFDANKDGQLDATETESLAKAIAEGIVPLPAHRPPHGAKPSAEMILNHIPGMYARVASYDANHDGALDATEQTALKSAIERGELACPHGQHPLCLGGSRH